ncbi:MAG: AbiEi antitoxin N-terminal domain-containing protein, partial [bacterium]|nr:AbiEi antitoxin N-terminal domain-containing protein [bacterium]
MNHQRTSRLKPLLDAVPPGFMVDTPWLRARGIDSKSIHDYVARGWLERVVRG